MAATATDGTVQPTANEKFFRYFQHEVTDLQKQMTRIQNTASSGGERADAVDHCLSAIARLSNEVQDASSYIPAYDQRTYGDAVKALNTKLQEVRAVHAPRQKFSFKNKALFSAEKNPSAISLNDAAEMANEKRRQIPGHLGLGNISNGSSYVNTPASSLTPARELEQEEAERQSSEPTQLSNDTTQNDTLSPNVARTIRQPSFSQSTSVTISDHDNIHIVLPTSASHATTSGTLSNLSNSIIDMSTPTTTNDNGKPFATLTLKNITSSLIICGHVSGAAHLTNIKNSTIVVACRQFRMHDSSNCDVYLLATSRPIIEDCSNIRFAPLPETYMTAKDREVENRWESVDDFKWLRSEQSPHWSVLGEEGRLSERVWRDVVPGGPDLGVEDILRAVRGLT